ncbi:MAG: DUF3160 domain-containing protein [Planctomycetota bacterium]|jgi:hypothetical protein
MRRPLLAVTLVAAASAITPLRADGPEPVEQQIFDGLLTKYEDMTYDQLAASLAKRDYLDQLSFDPTQASYFDRVEKELKLTAEELAIFKRNGFVSVDHRQRYSFSSSYYAIYARDLPVLVTTDSILDAVHKSYDNILMEIEKVLFIPTIDEVFTNVHHEIARRAGRNDDRRLAESYADLDLYVTVARNLLAGAGSDQPGPSPPHRPHDGWDGRLVVESKLGRDDEVLAVLNDVSSLKIQLPQQTPPTEIYGGTRYVDYSQFKPRGHYTKSVNLMRYFRTLMWLGRADCGFNVLPPDLRSGLEVDDKRELRDAALLTQLLAEADGLRRLRAMSNIIDFLVGGSDSLTIFAMIDLLDEQELDTPADLAQDSRIEKLQWAIAASGPAVQRIRSQVITSSPIDPSKVPPPAICQTFGQRYILDSFVLSQVVFDSIIFKGKKVERMMPRGLDVMAALGNEEAIPLLADDLRTWPYAANLKASIDYVNAHTDGYWHSNLYTIWLDCLRLLDDDMGKRENSPRAMRTKAWQMKQLQTQLGSWAQLRHDTILYAKQSYTAYPVCEYPAGYVEPYPEFYAKLRRFAETAAELFGQADYTGIDPKYQQRHVEFMKILADRMGTLEALARKELAAEPFTDEEAAFLKKIIDQDPARGSGPPRYDGWYPELCYGGDGAAWDPVVADIHTDPAFRFVLEVGVGDVNFLVIAIDSEDDRTAFVGPVYSYYEFRHPLRDRLTDQQWHRMIAGGELPARPAWTDVFQAPGVQRNLDKPP